MDEIEGTFGRIVVGDIMATNLDLIANDVMRPADVDVRRQHMTRRTHVARPTTGEPKVRQHQPPSSASPSRSPACRSDGRSLG